MSELRIALIGSTGLVGRGVMEQAAAFPGLRLTALARREVALPPGARMEMIVAEPAGWAKIIADLQPDALACALGTTWRKAGKNETAFRAVDHNLVLNCAAAAARAGVPQMIAVSSVGADPTSRAFYLRVKGEVERALSAMDFARVDLLRPGLLVGPRGDDRRFAERVGIAFSPLTNLFLTGDRRRYRAIRAEHVSRAILTLAGMRGDGRETYENDDIRRVVMRTAARRRLVTGQGAYGD